MKAAKVADSKATNTRTAPPNPAPPPQHHRPAPGHRDKAIAGFVLSLVGLLVFWPLGILGYTFANTTEKRYRTGELPAYYRGLVTAGKVLGILCMVALGIFIVILAAAVGLGMANG